MKKPRPIPPKTLLCIDALRKAHPEALTVPEIMERAGVHRNCMPAITSAGAAIFVGIRPGGGGNGLFRFVPDFDAKAAAEAAKAQYYGGKIGSTIGTHTRAAPKPAT